MTEFLMIMGVFALMIIGIAIGTCDLIASDDQEEIVGIVLKIQGWAFIVGSLFFGLFSILDILRGGEVLL